MIWELVKKEVIFLTSSLKSTIVSIIVISFFLPTVGMGFGMAMPALACYIGFYGILAYEEKSKMHLLNLALPVTRKEICLSKYIYAIGFIVFVTLLSSIGSGLGIVIRGGGELEGFIASLPIYMTLMFTVAIIYLAIVVPCIFYWGTIKARYVLLGIYIAIFIVANNMNSVMKETMSEVLTNTLSGRGIILIITIAVISMVISIGISLKIWEKKDVK